MKYVVYILLFVFGLTGFAQPNHFTDSSQIKTSLTLCADYHFASNAITNELFNKYIFSKYISTDVKDRVDDKLQSTNEVDFAYNYKINYGHTFKNNNLKWTIAFEQHKLIFSSFNDNLLKLILYGNQQYEGKNIIMNHVLFNNLKYEQFKIGLTKRFSSSTITHIVGGSLAFNNGSTNFDANISSSNLFTEKNGESLQLQVNSNFKSSTKKTNQFITSNGYGASIDLFYHFQNTNGTEIRIELNNLGFINWNKNSYNTLENKSYQFDGFYIDLFNIQSTNFLQPKTDSIKNELIYAKQKSYRSTIPVSLNINYSFILVPDKIRISTSLNTIFYVINTSILLLKPEFMIKRKYVIAPVFSYNTYNHFNLGMDLYATFCHGYKFAVGTHFLNGYLASKKSYGQGIYITALKTF